MYNYEHHSALALWCVWNNEVQVSFLNCLYFFSKNYDLSLGYLLSQHNTTEVMADNLKYSFHMLTLCVQALSNKTSCG